jgi:hypothetical protein
VANLASRFAKRLPNNGAEMITRTTIAIALLLALMSIIGARAQPMQSMVQTQAEKEQGFGTLAGVDVRLAGRILLLLL